MLLAGASAAVREQRGIRPNVRDERELEDALDGIRQVIGEPAVEAAYAAGRKLTLEQAIAEALVENA